MPREKKQLRRLYDCVVQEEWTETYSFRIDMGDKIIYLDDNSINGRGLIRQEDKNSNSKSSWYSSIDTVPGLKESISSAEKGEWVFVFEVESDYS